jgi:hypothetical protein
VGSERVSMDIWDQRPGSCDLLLRSTPFNNNYLLSIVSGSWPAVANVCTAKEATIHERGAVACAVSAQNEMNFRVPPLRTADTTTVLVLPNSQFIISNFENDGLQSPWKLRAQFLLSRERDVANIMT